LIFFNWLALLALWWVTSICAARLVSGDQLLQLKFDFQATLDNLG